MNETKIRERLLNLAADAPESFLASPQLLRRARRRMALTVVFSSAIALAVVAAGIAGVRWLDQADTTPAVRPGLLELRRDGEVLDVRGGDLVAVNPETREDRVLVEDLGVAYSARWSADGRWLAYLAPGPEGGIGLWVVGSTQEPRQVATDAPLWVWSSTGAELATIRMTSLRRSIAGSTLSMIDPVTGETTDVGSIPEDIGDVTSEPALSPDGTRFLFGARGGALYSVDASSEANSLLVRLPGEHLDSVDGIFWSPDGARIAVMNDLEPGGGNLYLMDADGSNIRVLTHDFDGMGVAWSPDGTRLAYVDVSGAHGVVWVASLDGSALVEVGRPPAVSCEDYPFCEDSLTWSPDGSRIAFRSASSDSVDVAAMDADRGGDAEPIDDLTYRSWDGGWYSCTCR